MNMSSDMVIFIFYLGEYYSKKGKISMIFTECNEAFEIIHSKDNLTIRLKNESIELSINIGKDLDKKSYKFNCPKDFYNNYILEVAKTDDRANKILVEKSDPFLFNTQLCSIVYVFELALLYYIEDKKKISKE